MIGRALVPIAFVLTLSQGCGAPPPAVAPARLCTPDTLDGCERRLLAGDETAKALARDYAAAREARDPADPWAKLVRDLDAPDRGPKPKAVIVVDGAAPAPATTAVRAVTSRGLPKPAGVPAEDLLVAIAAAEGYEELVVVRAGSAFAAYPHDPLAPWMAGLRPMARDDTAVAHAARDADADQAIRATFALAGASRFVDAARAAEPLVAHAEASDRRDEAMLRVRLALQLLGNAGLLLDPEDVDKAAAKQETTKAPPADAPLAADETPYGAYLRVTTSKDERAAWEARGARVLEGIAEDRREAMASAYARRRDCGTHRPPPVDDVRDLVFAYELAKAFPSDPTGAIGPGQLPPSEWIARYQRLVGIAARSGSAWSYLPALLAQRGETAGLSASGTPLYARVTDMGLAHLAATKELEEAFPSRYRAFTQVALAVSPGLLSDDRLRESLVKLTEASIADKVAAAKDAESLLLGILAGAAAGFSYPPAVQAAHLEALSGAVSRRLHGDFEDKAGWGTALLYALDAVYRVVADRGDAQAALRFASTQIARALSAPGVSPPALASLATAAARYAALAAEKKLDPAAAWLPADRMGPERTAARRGLRAAIAGLGAQGEAPESLLDDVTALTDGLVATLSTALAAGARKEAPRPGTCTSKASRAPLDASLRKALGKLGDVRRRILAHPRYKDGDGLWARRARLLVTVMSDAMDLALAGDAPMRAGAKARPVFTIPSADAERVAEGALREADKRAIVDLAGGAYGLFRAVVVAREPADLLKHSEKELRRAGAGLFGLFHGEGDAKGPALGVALLDALAAVHAEAKPGDGGGDDLLASLSRYASAFYAAGQTDRGDLCLLGTLVVSAFGKQRVPDALLDLASKSHSRAAWMVRFSEEVKRSAGKPDPSVYAADLRKATDDACQAANAEAVIDVMQAVHAYADGKKAEARATLDRVLDRADDEGLVVPRIAYQYEERTTTKVFQLTFDLSFGTGLTGGNAFQVGFGLRSPGEPGSFLFATLASPETTRAGEDAARFYVYTAALATVYHFLDGDAERATASAARAALALISGVKLGARTVRMDKPTAWGGDARAMLVVAGELAAEAGEPFLAGDLFTVVRQGLPEGTDDKAVAAVLDDLPVGLRGVKELAPVIERARRSLKILASKEPCADHKVEVGGFEETACGEYPLAIALRIADVLKKLPRLRRNAETGRQCGPLRSLDAFLGAADKGQYDPDAFTRAVEDLRAGGKIYDAAVLLARYKRPSHCGPAVVAAARALGRNPLVGPGLRADLLSEAVNCTAAGGGADVAADLVAASAETRKLADPTRNVKIVLSIADIAAREGRWEMLAKLVEQPDFVAQWARLTPNLGVIAIVLQDVTGIMVAKAGALDRTKASHALLCETFKANDHAATCALADRLRAPGAVTDEERRRVAKDVMTKLLEYVYAPAPKR